MPRRANDSGGPQTRPDGKSSAGGTGVPTPASDRTEWDVGNYGDQLLIALDHFVAEWDAVRLAGGVKTMSELTTWLSAEAEAVREIYAALNRNDIAAVMNAFDPQIERIEPEGFPSAGIFRGREAVRLHLTQGRSTWAEGGCEPEQFFGAGDKVVVFLHVHVRLKESTEWLDGRMADVFTFRHGKVVQMRSFGDQGQALT